MNLYPPGAARHCGRDVPRAVAAARGRADDPPYVAYLTALREVMSRSRRTQLTGVERLITLLPHPDRGRDAAAVLDEFVRGSLTRAGSTSTIGVARAIEALSTLARPLPPAADGPPGADRGQPRTAARLLASLHRIGTGLRGEWRLFGASLVGGVAYSALTVGLAFLLMRLARAEWGSTAAGHPGSWSVVAAGGAVATVFLGRALALFAQRVGARMVQVRLRSAYQAMLVERYRDLPMDWHRRQAHDERVDVVHADAETVWRPVAAVPVAVGGTAIVVGALLSLAWIDVRIMAVGLALLALLILTGLAYLLVLAPHVARAKAMRAEVVALGVGAARVDRHRERFERASAQLRRAVIDVRRVRSLFDPTVAALPALAGLVAAGVLAPNAAAVADGRLLATLFLFTVIASPVKSAGWLLAELVGGGGAAERLREVLSAPARMTFGPATASAEPPAVSFDGVSLVRPDDAGPRPVLHDVNLELRPGRIIAVVGAPGSGRSTFAMLAARRLDPDRGTVCLGGTDLRQLSREALDDQIAFVASGPHPLQGTVRSVVTLGRDGLSDDDVWQALRVVHSDELVARLNDGLDSPVGPGERRFGDLPRHRLALAGALIGRPRVLVLDTASSGEEFDPPVLRAMRRYHEVTIIVVTNQADAIVLADDVVYIDADGTTIARPHGELVRNNPAYAGLFSRYRTTPFPPRATRDAGPGRGGGENVLHGPPRRSMVREGPIERLAELSSLPSAVAQAVARAAADRLTRKERSR